MAPAPDMEPSILTALHQQPASHPCADSGPATADRLLFPEHVAPIQHTHGAEAFNIFLGLQQGLLRLFARQKQVMEPPCHRQLPCKGRARVDYKHIPLWILFPHRIPGPASRRISIGKRRRHGDHIDIPGHPCNRTGKIVLLYLKKMGTEQLRRGKCNPFVAQNRICHKDHLLISFH